jgi:hypothetical protein
VLLDQGLLLGEAFLGIGKIDVQVGGKKNKSLYICGLYVLFH